MSGGWYMGGMWFFWILLFVALAVVVGWALAMSDRRDGHTGVTGGDGIRTPDNAEDVLKKRYARGEISREEFEDRLHAVRG
jgi:putative membrane protein